MSETLTTYDCRECDGGGEVEHAYCTRPADGLHMGYHCGGSICGGYYRPCEECKGTGTILCNGCGEHPATHSEDWISPSGRVVTDYYCEACREEE